MELGADRIRLRVQRKMRVGVSKITQKILRSRNGHTGSSDLIDYADELSSHRRQLIEANYRATAAYTAQPYQGQVYLLKARAQPLLHQVDSKLVWQKLALKGLKVDVIPGSHEGIFKQPHVQTLAQQIAGLP